MTNFRRQTIVIAVLIVLIAVAGFYAKRFNDTVKDTSGKTGKANFFTETKMTRDNQISLKKQDLESIINNESSTAEAKNAASAELMALSDKAEKQSNIESLIKERGFEDAVCLIDDNGVEVTVKQSGEALTQKQVNDITEIVVRKTSMAPTGIVVKQRKN